MIETKAPSVREHVGEAEWETRVNLAACYRLVSLYGMSDMTNNHITARVPGQHDHFLINPYGLVYEQVTASNLIKIDLDGNVVMTPGGGPISINLAGYKIHSVIHAARRDVQCVAHIHTRAGMAVSAMKCGLLHVSQDSLRFYKRIGYYDWTALGSNFTPEEQARLVDSLGSFNALIMRNHGLLTCGASIPEAFNSLYALHKSCTVQVDAMAARTELIFPSEEALDRVYKYVGDGRGRGLKEWDAMLWQAERADPSYKT